MGNPEKVVHIGESGAGQLCKLCNQMVIGGTLVVVAEALALARKAGVDAGKGARSAARRICGEPRARSPRRARAQGHLQAGIQDASVREGHAERRLDAGRARHALRP